MGGPDHNGIVAAGVSRARSAEKALAEALAGLDLAGTAFLLLFIPETLPPAAVAAALQAQAPGVTAFGCTTAGQITERGYENEALLALAFPARHFRCASLRITPGLAPSISQIAEDVRGTNSRFASAPGWNRFALMMADGLGKQEDMLVAALEAGLNGVPVFGGSAGDGLAFERTHVLQGGQVHPDAALLILVETDLSFVGLGFDHFLPTERRMVVTAARPEARIVSELNGSPAAREYARLIGCAPDALGPEIFAGNPLLVRNGSTFHVRAVQEVTEDGALVFLSAIDDGIILTLGRGIEILETLRDGLAVTDPGQRAPGFILGFECILRKLEIEQKGLSDAVSQILSRAQVRGFSTYGEQHRGAHVNQTFVGVAFFPPATVAAR